ncbi:MAG: glycosyltransferase family 2 protein [Myxococcota bacterium]
MPLTAVVIPALNCQATLERVLAEIPEGHLVLVVDDGSREPLRAPVRVLRHPVNRGYGAAQKTGYAAALDAGAERIVLLHGDGQYDTADTLGLASGLADAEAVLGSRFLSDPRVIPGWRRVGNRALTGLANARFGARHSELHTGARAFRASALRELPLARFSDDYLFDQQVLCGLLRARRRIAERPVRVRYDGTVQSISFGRSVAYGLGCVWEILR